MQMDMSEGGFKAAINPNCLLGCELSGRYLKGLAVDLVTPTRPLLVEIAFDGHVMMTARALGIVYGRQLGRYFPEADLTDLAALRELPGGFEFFLSDYLPLASPMNLTIRAISDGVEFGRLERVVDIGSETIQLLLPMAREHPLIRFSPISVEGDAINFVAACHLAEPEGVVAMGENCKIEMVKWDAAPQHELLGNHLHGLRLSARVVPIDAGAEARVFLTRNGVRLGGYGDYFYLPPNVLSTLENAIVPMPAQIDRVMSSLSKLDYLFTGYASFRVIQQIVAARTQMQLSSETAVLDWGVGCGRVARHFAHAGMRVTGVDIDPQNAAWCKQNLAGTYDAISSQPPTNLRSQSIDLVVGISIFTHLTEADQFLWLAELSRVLRPGGHALVTIQSEYALLRSATPMRRILTLIQSGIDDAVVGTRLDDVVGPQSDYYRETFHQHDYVRKTWSRWFDVVAIETGEHFSHQDYVVLRAR